MTDTTDTGGRRYPSPISSTPTLLPSNNKPLLPHGHARVAAGFALERSDSLSRRPKGGAPPALRLLIPHSNKHPLPSSSLQHEHAAIVPTSPGDPPPPSLAAVTTPTTALMSPLSPHYSHDPDETGPLPLSPTHHTEANLDPDRSMDQLKTVAWKPRRIMNRSPRRYNNNTKQGSTSLKKVPTLTRIMPPPSLLTLPVPTQGDPNMSSGGDVSPSVAPSSPRTSYVNDDSLMDHSFHVHDQSVQDLTDALDKTVLDTNVDMLEEGDDTELDDDDDDDDDLVPTPLRLLPRHQLRHSPPPVPPMIPLSLEDGDMPYSSDLAAPPPAKSKPTSPRPPDSPSVSAFVTSPLAFDSSTTNRQLLSGCLVAIEGFTSVHMPGLRDLVAKHGATLAPHGTSPVSPGYVGVGRRFLMLPVACPAIVQYKNKYAEELDQGMLHLVTDAWLYHSLTADVLLAPEASFLYRPHLLHPLQSLAGSQVALAGFQEFDRRALVVILQALGARIHGTFRVTSDVVISAVPDDDLEKRASAWGARVASIKWIETMVETGTYAMPRNFPIRTPRPLDGVLVYVTESVEQVDDMHLLAQSLGARYLTSFAPRCTHVVHMRKHPPLAGSDIKDLPEVEIAHGLDRFVVSPWWLTMCSRENKRLPEVNYPSWFFPDAPVTASGV